MDMNMTPIPQNYKNNVNWVLGAYTDAGVTFPNGFQKDAIQNAVGARKRNSFQGWVCNISLIENGQGKYLLIEDSGTVGLTGKNTPADEVNQMMARGEELPEKERLSRFTSMFNSGNNSTGPGLYGAGKSVYSVASKTYTYYFDSLRDDGKYVANVNKCGQVNSVALEEDEAKSFIYDNTGLSEKLTTGTRVIIESPKEELLNAIETGDLVAFIQESWWKIIQRFDGEAGIIVNGKRVEVPNDVFDDATHKYKMPNPETYSMGYRVKHFGLYLFEKGNNRWSGISYYRKGMKIGEIDLRDIPKKVEGNFWGYIEVDEKWEDDLADIEDKVHFGVSKGQKKTTTYQNLKNFCNNKFKAKLTDWGYIKDQESSDKKLRDDLREIANDLQDLFDKLGFEDLGNGPQKADFDVRWQDIRYPTENSESVTSGDSIDFSMRITSSYATDKTFEYKMSVIDPMTGEVVSQIDNDKIKVEAGAVFKKGFSHIVNKNNSVQYAENRILLSVKVAGSGKEKRKELPYFYDTDKPDNSREIVTLALHECMFPSPGSRRVNFDETIKNVCYRIENKRNIALNYRLNISINNVSDPDHPMIASVATITGEIEPFEELVTSRIDSIVFDRETYEPYLEQGILELRARLVANENDTQFEKGDRITAYNYKIYLNMDEKNGKHDSFKPLPIEDPDNFRRSWLTPGNDRTIALNVGHTAYLNLAEYPEIQYEYLREQMLKQYVLLYLAEGKFDMFSDQTTVFSEMDSQEAIDQVLLKIESVYFQSLR